MARLVFPEKTTELSIVVDLVADLTVINPFDFFVEPEAEAIPFAYEPELLRDLGPYLECDPAGPLLRRVARPSVDRCRAEGTPDGRLPRRASTSGSRTTSPTRPAWSRACRTPRRRSARRSARAATAAGCSCRCCATWASPPASCRATSCSSSPTRSRSTARRAPRPTSPTSTPGARCSCPAPAGSASTPPPGLFAGEGHIPLARHAPARVGRARSPAPPSRARSRSTSPTRSPGCTRTRGSRFPYTDDQWAAHRRGRPRGRRRAWWPATCASPRAASPRSCRSTTWTPRSGPIGADGDDKRAQGVGAHRPPGRARSPRAALLHAGQGKWYPGEPLPRWQLGIHWRTDGDRLWSHPELLADPFDARHRHPRRGRARWPSRSPPAWACPPGSCTRRTRTRSSTLLNEARTPAGEPPADDVDPDDPALADEAGRASAVAALDAAHRRGRRLGHAAAPPPHRAGRLGHQRVGAAPRPPGAAARRLARRPAPARSTRSPGRPPEPEPERSPFEPGPVAEAVAVALARPESAAPRLLGHPRRVAPGTSAVVPVDEAPPTALGVELRDGRVARVPAAARPPRGRRRAARRRRGRGRRAAGMPVVIEGYPPPRDPRHRTLVVTPDPGVIEVNLQPARSWEELVETTEVLYEAARESRLGTEKFELDGTHSGTGGGNHVTLGGATAGRQPVPAPARPAAQHGHLLAAPPVAVVPVLRPLRRPHQPGAPRRRGPPRGPLRARDRLRRAGPPRRRRAPVARRPALPPPARRPHRQHPPGRVLHRQALHPRGRARPPRPARAARLRDAAAPRRWRWCRRCSCGRSCRGFWDDPYEARSCAGAPSCTTASCCPTRSRTDIAAVVDDLVGHGIAFELSWLDPFLEFRFPRLGTVEVAGRAPRAAGRHRAVARARRGGLASRAPPATSTRRSSGCRSASRGSTPGRHVVTCNGRAVPLRPTADPGTHVAGVRYRAWQPPSALHPTIGVHSPLVFDVVDLAAGRSLGGCTYHVSHPGGRNYDRFPVNANEAEARRTAASARSATPRARSTWPDWSPSCPASTGTLAPWTCAARRRWPRRRLFAPRTDVATDRRAMTAAPHHRAARRLSAPPTGVFDELLRRRRRPQPLGPRGPHPRPTSGPIELTARRQRGAAPARRRRRHLQRHVSDGSTEVRSVDPRPGARGGLGRGVGRHRGGPGPAGRAARPRAHRPLRPAPADGRGRAPARGRLRPPGLPAPVRRDPPARRAPAVPRRLRPRPRRRRRLDGAVRPHPGARRAWATRSRTGSSSPGCCPTCTATPRSCASRRSSARCAPRCSGSPRPRSRSPRIVVLTPGPWSETAFEHGCLATYLGYPLVQGSDLRVRDGRVWMRTLGRLEPVHVILRRVDPPWCDPLELRPDSTLGVPGLLEACRVGHRLGGQHARQRRAREPRRCCRSCPQLVRGAARPAAEAAVGRARWWCGDPDVAARRARPPRRARAEVGVRRGAHHASWARASRRGELDELRARIEAEPHAWVGQEPVAARLGPHPGRRRPRAPPLGAARLRRRPRPRATR